MIDDRHPLNFYTRMMLVKIQQHWQDWNAHAQELRSEGSHRFAEAEVFEACMAQIDDVFQSVQRLHNEFAMQFKIKQVTDWFLGVAHMQAENSMVDNFTLGFITAHCFDPLAHAYAQVLVMMRLQSEEYVQGLIAHLSAPMVPKLARLNFN